MELKDNIQSTKFLMAMTILLLSFALVVLKMLDALDWFKWAVGLVGVFSGANVLAKFADKNSAN